MKVYTNIAEMKQACRKWQEQGKTIGLVPTMGYLHAGHMSLVKAARDNNDIVVVSIFVNPSQFGPGEDFSCYPRDMAADTALCEQVGVDAIFAPSDQEMYPTPYISYVEPVDLADKLCGKSRPGHFRGVCTVVLKLFNIVRPDNAYFGQKDAQQFIILQQMVKDLNLDVAMQRLPIVREADGLAMSSRNVYLNAQERQQALQLSRALEAAKKIYGFGERSAAVLIAAMQEEIDRAELAKVDYLEIVDSKTLQAVETIDGEVLMALAVYFGKTRLIDNSFLG